MEQCLITEEIKTETSPMEDTEIEKYRMQVENCIKNELLHEEEQTWKNDPNFVESELANQEDCNKTKIEVYEEKIYSDQVKKELEDTVDHSKFESSDCDTKLIGACCSIKQDLDYDMNEEFDIKSETNSLQSCDDMDDSFQPEGGILKGVKSVDFSRRNYNRLNKWRKDAMATRNMKTRNVSANSVKLLKCISCNYLTRSRVQLHRHFKKVHGKLKDAQRSKASRRNLKNQIQTKLTLENTERQENEMRCKLCVYSTTIKSLLDYHMDRIHLKLERYKCLHCDYRTMLKIHLRRHIRNHDKKIQPSTIEKIKKQNEFFKCDLCDYSSKYKCYLRYHKDRVHLKMKKHKCNLCDYVAFNKSTLRNHIDSIHLGRKDFGCEYCDFSTSWKGSLQYHIISKHTNEITSKLLKKFKCDQCDFSARARSSLKSHINAVHLKLRKYVCTHCEYSASAKSTVKRHIDRTHVGMKQFKCENCNFSTAYKQSLENHLKFKHSEQITSRPIEKFKCNLCDYSAKLIWKLKYHKEAVHLKLKKHKCPQCDYSASRKALVTCHINRIHLGKTFKCDNCDFSTAWKRYLKIHLKSKHGNEITSKVQKKFKCDLCDYSVGTRWHLERHVDGVHLKLKKYECDHCEYKASRKRCLKNHIDNVHLIRKINSSVH